MKYVIAENPSSGHLYPAVFDEEITHSLVAKGMISSGGRYGPPMAVISAGFVYLQHDGTWKVDGRASESLGGMGPREADEMILNLFLRFGLSGNDLTNMLTYVRIQLSKGLSMEAAFADAVAVRVRTKKPTEKGDA